MADQDNALVGTGLDFSEQPDPLAGADTAPSTQQALSGTPAQGMPDLAGPDTTPTRPADFNQDQSVPSVQTSDAYKASQPGSLWHNILQGALIGLTGAGNAKSFAGGLANGAAAVTENKQRQLSNKIVQDQNARAQNESDARLANLHLDQQKLAQQYANMPKSRQEALDIADEELGTQLQNQGNQPIFTSNAKDAEGRAEAQRSMSQSMSSDANSPLSYVTHRNANGTYSVYNLGPDTNKLNRTDMEVTTMVAPPVKPDGTLDWDATPIETKHTVPPNSIKIVDGIASSTAAHANYEKSRQDALAARAKEKEAEQTPEYKSRVELQQAQVEKARHDNSASANTPDPFGNVSTLDPKEYSKRYNKFNNSYVLPLTKTDQTVGQFSSILTDVTSGKDMTGAQSIVGLFDAIGISATPLKGQGFRLNKDVIKEHMNARGWLGDLQQKFLGAKAGDVITPQQLQDYAKIATQARESQYASAIDEARRESLPVDFLPKGNGTQIDASTARMYLRAANGNNDAARKAAQASGWKF